MNPKPSLPPGTKQLTRRGHNNSSISMDKLCIHDSLARIHMKTKHFFISSLLRTLQLHVSHPYQANI
ncbi:hypothetical protein PVAP13_4KG309205 [Panicum virgatum]|uniref:Uncharacterized protein n=1 Tax=Panicum virgatum TaxID=38727 RepID=A0A8T0TXX0_PANVG|nr:hypothetical protein PVAP13_4KG309205 [Panicum virgatum]